MHHLPKSIRHTTPKIISIHLTTRLLLLVNSLSIRKIGNDCKLMAVIGLLIIVLVRLRLIGIELIEILTIDMARYLRAWHCRCDVAARLRSVKGWRYQAVRD